MRRRFYTFLIIVAMLFCTMPTHADEAFEKRLSTLEKSFYANDGARFQRKYAELLVSRAKKYEHAKDYANASYDLMGALYLLDETGELYKKTFKKLDEVLALSGQDQSESGILDLAKNLHGQKKYYAALWLFENAAEQKYEREVCYAYIGDIMIAQGSLKQGVNYYKKSLEVYPQNVLLKLRMAYALEALEESDLALEQYRQILALTSDRKIVDEIATILSKRIVADPTNQNNYELLGTCYAKLVEYDKTYVLYKKAIEIKPNDIFLKYILAGILHEIKESSRAIEIYDSILNDDIYESQIRIGKAKCLEKLGKINEAVKEYQSILIFYPNSEQAKYGIYNLLKAQVPVNDILATFYPLDDNFKPDSVFLADFAYTLSEFNQNADAQNFYNMALKSDNKNKKAYVNLYTLYAQAGKDAQAKELIKKANMIFPNDAEILKLYSSANKVAVAQKTNSAADWIKAKNYQKAIEAYMEVEPKTADTYFAIASSYRELKNYSKTVESYKAGLAIDPKNIEGLYRLAMVYFENGDLDNSRVYLEKTLQVNRGYTSARKLLDTIATKQTDEILNTAYDAFEKKDYKKTHEIITEGLKKYPNNHSLLYYRAINYEAQNDLKNAVNDLQSAIKADPESGLPYFTLAQILERTGNGKEALGLYERFLSGTSDDKEMIRQAQKRVEELSKKYY